MTLFVCAWYKTTCYFTLVSWWEYVSWKSYVSLVFDQLLQAKHIQKQKSMLVIVDSKNSVAWLTTEQWKWWNWTQEFELLSSSIMWSVYYIFSQLTFHVYNSLIHISPLTLGNFIHTGCKWQSCSHPDLI